MFSRKSCNSRSRATIDFPCAIVQSFQTINFHSCNTFLMPDVLEVLYVRVSVNCMTDIRRSIYFQRMHEFYLDVTCCTHHYCIHSSVGCTPINSEIEMHWESKALDNSQMLERCLTGPFTKSVRRKKH